MTKLSPPTDLDSLQSHFALQSADLGLSVAVPPDGNFTSTMAIVGEGAGAHEVDKHLPFVGPTGMRLWDLLRSQKLSRPQFFITNVIKRQFSTASEPRFPIPTEERLKWRSMLAWELRCLPNLKHIFALGNEAMETLTGHTGITNRRGSVYSCILPGLEHVKVVCTFNPAHIMRNPQVEISLLLDVERFSSVVRSEVDTDYVIDTVTNPSFRDAMLYIKKMVQQRTKRPVSYDIETIGLYTACHGIGNSAHEAMCINLRSATENRYTPQEEYDLLLALQDMAGKCRMVAQNGNFDAHWTGYKDLLHIPIWFDTMLAHHTLYPTLPHGLDYIVAQYTTHPYYKDERAQYKEGGDIEAFWRYNGKDVALTWECHRILHEELREQKLAKFFFDHVMRLDPILARITIDGLLVDRKVKDKVAADLSKDVAKSLEAFHDAVQRVTEERSYFPNPAASKQMHALYLDRLNLPSVDRSVDKYKREGWLHNDKVSAGPKLIIQRHNIWQRDAKFLSTYANMRIDPDGRVRYTYSQTGVASAPGRLSSSKTLWGTGANMQNQPGRAHEFYISDPNTVFFYFDLSQAEARMVAWLADIPTWKEQFEKARIDGKFDCHRALASTMFKTPYDKVPKEDWVKGADGVPVMTIRYKAKRCRHGLNYRMAYETLAEKTGMDLYDAKKCYIIYHHETPELRLWWSELTRIARRDRELWTPLGRRMKILQRIDEAALESIVAFVPQSTIGDKVKQIMYRAMEHDKWDNNKMRLKLNIHDALIGIATPSAVKTALKICKDLAEEPIMVTDVYGRSTSPLIIPADCKISQPDKRGLHRWSTLQKVHM